MSELTKNELETLLKNVENSEKILAYIEELEKNKCKCKDKGEEHHHHHHHDEDCDCGCHEENDEWEEIEDRFKKDFSVSEWESVLKDKNCFSKDELKLLKRLRHVAMPTSAYELADQFGGGGAYWYGEIIKTLGNGAVKKFGLDEFKNKENWFIALKCWNKPSQDIKYYGLKPELYEAIGNVDMSDVELWENHI